MTCQEKEKMLDTSIFSLSRNIFYSNQDKFHNNTYSPFVVCTQFHLERIKNFIISEHHFEFCSNPEEGAIWKHYEERRNPRNHHLSKQYF